MMEAVRTSETSVDNYFTRQYIPEDKSELSKRASVQNTLRTTVCDSKMIAIFMLFTTKISDLVNLITLSPNFLRKKLRIINKESSNRGDLTFFTDMCVCYVLTNSVLYYCLSEHVVLVISL
jgi:hypothetical protein